METEEEEISVPRLKEFYRYKDPKDPREGQYLKTLRESSRDSHGSTAYPQRKVEELELEKTPEPVESEEEEKKGSALSSYVEDEEEFEF